METMKLQSPKMNELIKQLTANKSDALHNFWTSIEKEGAPLIEEIEGDKTHALITFLYRQQREDINNVIIYGVLPGYRYSENVMERLMDTDVWFKTYKIRNDIKFKYNFSLNYEFDEDFKKVKKNSVLDPLNPNKIVFIKNDEDPEDTDNVYSLVKMPDIKPDRWTITNKDTQKGHINLSRFHSDILGDSRRIWVYTPNGYTQDNSPYNLLVLNDGFDYLNYLSAQTVLDNLIADGEIPPLVCVLIDSCKNRYERLTCNEAFAGFLTEELMPWVYENYNVTKNPEETVIGGVSLGGLSASYFALKNPNIFGNVLSQSGSYWVNSEWLTKQYENAEKLPIKFYMNCGVLEDLPYDSEPIMMVVINNMRDVLLSKGYDVAYETFQSGHDYLGWGETLGTGLIALLGKNR